MHLSVDSHDHRAIPSTSRHSQGQQATSLVYSIHHHCYRISTSIRERYINKHLLTCVPKGTVPMLETVVLDETKLWHLKDTDDQMAVVSRHRLLVAGALFAVESCPGFTVRMR